MRAPLLSSTMSKVFLISHPHFHLLYVGEKSTVPVMSHQTPEKDTEYNFTFFGYCDPVMASEVNKDPGVFSLFFDIISFLVRLGRLFLVICPSLNVPPLLLPIYLGLGKEVEKGSHY